MTSPIAKTGTGYTLCALAALLAALAILLGAFGAHALEQRVSADRLHTFETATRYMMYHALGILITGLLSHITPNRAWQRIAILMFLGTLCFSGSLILLVLLDAPALGAITPIGGTLWIISWLWMAYTLWRTAKQI